MPTFLVSTWVLEEDLKQTERFVRSFLEYADHFETFNSPKLKTTISLLSMVFSVLAEHLLAEEEMIFPVADQNYYVAFINRQLRIIFRNVMTITNSFTTLRYS
ncbi:hypothetical protein GK047_07655 [Paenibacillus sp. SYP-B3998]|uniref:Hemerythrin-like domain-containing protein n=1 Tax=Paenibacillus sp. SYP-B3998 TaxID=2678564 RepID=A0A6G3ZWU9_9BACL|nr:hypothetical protein [Paenibacillus sp. SYP-B3998]